ncbi:hypothetical protein H9L39_03239 [Fusarium oxysporum f. sp. albedinis]|nr:hypothetical protein H9L39_03239 [Fusarium oxysporum f. sp. albedinis]
MRQLLGACWSSKSTPPFLSTGPVHAQVFLVPPDISVTSDEDLVELCLSTESKEEVQLDIAANLNASGNKLFSQSSRRQLDTSNDQGT